jgi:hypothetical protein
MQQIDICKAVLEANELLERNGLKDARSKLIKGAVAHAKKRVTSLTVPLQRIKAINALLKLNGIKAEEPVEQWRRQWHVLRTDKASDGKRQGQVWIHFKPGTPMIDECSFFALEDEPYFSEGLRCPKRWKAPNFQKQERNS